jgi:cyclohexadienyl dehydratase
MIPNLARRLVMLVAIIVGILASTGTSHAGPTTQIDRLYGQIEQRLSYMKDVAAWKWQNNRPIEDLGREAMVLSNTQMAAAAYGLDGPSTTAFFEAQIAAAKFVQQTYFNHWQSQGYDGGTPRDLQDTLRPAISRTGDDILALISLALPQVAAANEGDLIADLALPKDLRVNLAEGLKQIHLNDEASTGRFTAIMYRGAVRVGTTGDYAPFSTGAIGQRTGIDIDLALSLADYMDVRLVFVETSWPSLLEDLADYDIGMSGISIMPFRQEIGHMSVPYHTGGKTPIIRCTDRAKFSSMQDIDQPQVRMIVNPGGTNERFARAHIEQASLDVFSDNTEIFGEIVAGRADVMITDAIEVAYQAARDPRLCPALPGQTLTVAEKGFLMPKDDLLLKHVNRWLGRLKNEGTLDAIFDAHLNPSGQAAP